jgi:GNAT superfamily N-acetyltransferase
MSEFELRAGTGADHPLIYSATAKSLRSSPLYRDLPPDQYTQGMNGIVSRMLLEPWSQTIAYPQGYPDEIAGFVLHRQTEQGKPVIGVVYVKSAYRLRGLGRQLLEHATHGQADFLAVLAQPRTLSWCRDRGLNPQLSPLFL